MKNSIKSLETKAVKNIQTIKGGEATVNGGGGGTTGCLAIRGTWL